jgi:hypothetical protein
MKAARRELRVANGPIGEPLRILRGIHKTIQNHCHESSRRCWEYMLEMLAHSSGWETESDESKHLWDKMYAEDRWPQFLEAWHAEVKFAKANGGMFSEPIGQLLEEIEGTNAHLGQFMTPMPVVRMMNAMTLNDMDDEPLRADGFPTHRGIDPCCGTGRFIIDSLVHNQNLMMHGVDLDIWMLRTAMLNVRLLAPWTSLRLKDPADRLRPLRRARKAIERMAANPFSIDTIDTLGTAEQIPTSESGDVLVIGGRAIFIHGDALIVDLDYTNNWLCAGWAWKPHPWTWNLKMAGYYGSYEDWERAGRPDLREIAKAVKTEIQFDYSMRQPAPAP